MSLGRTATVAANGSTLGIERLLYRLCIGRGKAGHVSFFRAVICGVREVEIPVSPPYWATGELDHVFVVSYYSP